MEITERAIHLLAEVARSMRTYHPDGPFALWRDPDGQRYLLDRFFTKLLKLQEAMTTTTGRAMAERRIAFLRLYLQELQHELAEGGYGNDMPEEVTYRLSGGCREEKSRRNGQWKTSKVGGSLKCFDSLRSSIRLDQEKAAPEPV